MAHSLARVLRTPALFALALWWVLSAPHALAQPETEAVRIRAVAQHAKYKPGDRAVIAVELKHAPKFHTYPASHISLPASIDAIAIRTAIGLADGAPRWAHPLGIQWPEPHPGPVPNIDTGKGTVTIPLYSATVIAYVTVEIAADAPLGDATIPIEVKYQACNETSCLPDESPVIPVPVTVSSETGAPVSEPALFAGYKPGEVGVAIATTPPAPSLVSAESRTLFGINVGSGLLLVFLAAVLGGVVLNLTPCVLPIIPLKIMTLVHHAGSSGRRVVLGLWMALGVVAFWSALAIPVLALRSTGQGDPSQLIFGTWWLTLALGLLIALMGLGIMGLFSIQLPQTVYAINPKADSPWGSFLYGVMAGVLGLPCFGFVAGGLLAGLVTMPWPTVVTVFVGLGVGMGAPYLILSIWPALIEKIPRTGPASELVKQVMGLLLIAFAGFFVAAGIESLLKTMPYLSKSMAIWIVAFFVLIAALWLSVRTLQISRRAWPKMVMPVLSLLAALGLIAWIGRGTATDREDWVRAVAAADDAVISGAWLEYTPRRFDRAAASGKIVVAEFTSASCITCKFLKRSILDVDPVRSRLRSDDVIMLEVDTSVRGSPGDRLLASLGLVGVPQLVIWAPHQHEPAFKFGAYTPGVVIDALENAKARSAENGVSRTRDAKDEDHPPAQGQ